MASANIKLGYKTAAWFTSNDTLVLKVGQIVYLEQTGIYKLGDGVTQLSALAFLGGNGLAYTPEDVANKSTSVNTDQASNTKYPSVKAVYDWAVGLFTKRSTLTTNTIPKATASDTIGDSSITDDGTKVTVNGGFYATTGASEIFVFGDTANITADGQTNTNIETNLTENILRHNVKNTFDAPANNFPQLTASQRVETDANKNLISVPNEIDYTESFAYTGSPFTLTVAPSFIYSIRTTSMILDEKDANDVTIVGTTLTVINPAFQSGETLYIKYKG